MTGSAALRIPRADLVLGRALGDGGQGRVWEVEKRLINKTWPVAFKEYKPQVRGQLRVDALERMVAFLPGRPTATGEWLARNTAWPAALVTERGDVCGFLMRQIPDDFFLTVPSGERKARGFEFLLNPQDFVARTVGEVSPRQTFGLLLALADTLERMHALGVVAGDLSPKNLLFSLSGQRPGCFLIDCDAMGVGGDWALRPVQTLGWKLPEGEAPETRQGDTYKFALLAVRLFLHEQHGQDPAALARMDATVGDLAARGLSRTPSDRPALSEWLDPLRRAVDHAPTTWPTAGRTAGATRTAGAARTAGASRTAGAQTVTANAAAGVPTAARVRAGAAAGGTRPGAAVPPYTQSPGSPQRKSSNGAAQVAIWIALIVIALVAWLAWRGHGSDSGSGGSGSTGRTSVHTPGTREEQAAALNTLLSENAGRRSGVADAVQSMMRCSGLDQARQVFSDAADARTSLLDKLDELSTDQLPGGLVSELRSAWQSSKEADQAYARVVDEVSGSCSSGSVAGASAWQDASTASNQATAAKQDFVAVWNPLAQEFGLGTRVWTDL
ncbi:hypothetical protein [Streptomyces sp. NPDC046197]|uniref:hypothetical protein n=1 Tax=Streptomyces sp. NPDC046197 TaxID=3154337 RepID=UPI0033DDBBAA